MNTDVRNVGRIEEPPRPTAHADWRTPEEVEAVAWIHAQVAAGRRLPVLEAEAVVDLVFAERRWGGRPLIPLVPVQDMSSFLAVQAVNVSSLAMALAESLQFEDPAVRRVGVAALLHDIGMVRLAPSILSKPGQISPEERAEVVRHPIEGARILLAADASLDLAAVVAYEHHLRMDGSGYPHLSYPRSAHYVSRLIQLCDVFCGLYSPRPYRVAWPLDIILSFLAERAGFEFHPTLTVALTSLVQQHVSLHAAAMT
jgi:HD-GYP domain-containing protein (c-di-GMP phosphodiesterase class II)